MHASKEREATTTVIQVIEGNIVDSRCVADEILYTKLDYLDDGSLILDNPDLHYVA